MRFHTGTAPFTTGNKPVSFQKEHTYVRQHDEFFMAHDILFEFSITT